MRRQRLDLTGQKYGTFRVKGRGTKSRYWKLECNCGRVFEATGSRIKAEQVKCDCQKTLKHGHARRGNLSPEYSRWRGMKARCKHDKNYAGLVGYDPRWESFQNFYADMGPMPAGFSLDRKNPFEGYSPRNCRWAPPDVQATNKRQAGLLRYDWSPDSVGVADGEERHGGALGTVAEWAWYLAKVTNTPSWTAKRLHVVLQVLRLEDILRMATPWGVTPEELSYMAGPDFSHLWAEFQKQVYLHAA